MKKLLFIPLLFLSIVGYSQMNTFGGIGLRVNDTTTYQTNAASYHTGGYYDIYFNNQATNDHFDVWNGSSYDHIFSFSSGGNFWKNAGTTDLTADVLINGGASNAISITSDKQVLFYSTVSGDRTYGFYAQGNLEHAGMSAGSVTGDIRSFIKVNTDSVDIVSVHLTTNDSTRIVVKHDELNLDLPGPLKINGSAGTSGYVLQSNGAGASPTWVAPTGGGYTPFIQTGEVYVEIGGNDGTGVLGDRDKPFATINAALVAGAAVSNLKVNIGMGTFAAPSTANLRPNLWVSGSGKPGYNATISENPAGTYTVGTPTALVGGTIINGGMSFAGANATNVHVSDLGMDVGSAWGGTVVDCLVFTASPTTIPISMPTNITVRNFTALGRSSASAFHCIAIQSVYGVTLENVDTWFAAHGIAVKSSFAIINNTRHRSHGDDAIIVKSDNSSSNRNIINNFQVIGGAGVIFESGTGAATGPSGNIVTNGTINGVTGDGLRSIGTGAVQYFNTFDNIQVISSTADGFDINTSGRVEINNCLAISNTGKGYVVRVVSGQFYNAIKNSTAIANGSQGFDVDALGGTRIYLKNCHTENNIGAGYLLGNEVYTIGNSHIGGTAAISGSVGSTNQNYELTTSFGGNPIGPAALRILEDSDNGANYVGLTVASSLSGNLTYTLPSAAPTTNGAILTSTTAGVMSWVDKLAGSATLNFDLTSVNSQDLTITVTGAADGDVVSIGHVNASATANVIYTAWVSATNTVTVRASRIDVGSGADPASGTFKAIVFK